MATEYITHPKEVEETAAFKAFAKSPLSKYLGETWKGETTSLALFLYRSFTPAPFVYLIARCAGRDPEHVHTVHKPEELEKYADILKDEFVDPWIFAGSLDPTDQRFFLDPPVDANDGNRTFQEALDRATFMTHYPPHVFRRTKKPNGNVDSITLTNEAPELKKKGSLYVWETIYLPTAEEEIIAQTPAQTTPK